MERLFFSCLTQIGCRDVAQEVTVRVHSAQNLGAEGDVEPCAAAG